MRYLCAVIPFVARRILHTFFSLWLATLLLFGVTPKEAMHAFAHHTDTIHRHNEHGALAESAHHHCSFLGFQLLPFSAPITLPVVCTALLPEHVSFLLMQDERAAQQAAALRESRGPPVS